MNIPVALEVEFDAPSNYIHFQRISHNYEVTFWLLGNLGDNS